MPLAGAGPSVLLLLLLLMLPGSGLRQSAATASRLHLPICRLVVFSGGLLGGLEPRRPTRPNGLNTPRIRQINTALRSSAAVVLRRPRFSPTVMSAVRIPHEPPLKEMGDDSVRIQGGGFAGSDGDALPPQPLPQQLPPPLASASPPVTHTEMRIFQAVLDHLSASSHPHHNDGEQLWEKAARLTSEVSRFVCGLAEHLHAFDDSTFGPLVGPLIAKTEIAAARRFLATHPKANGMAARVKRAAEAIDDASDAVHDARPVADALDAAAEAFRRKDFQAMGVHAKEAVELIQAYHHTGWVLDGLLGGSIRGRAAVDTAKGAATLVLERAQSGIALALAVSRVGSQAKAMWIDLSALMSAVAHLEKEREPALPAALAVVKSAVVQSLTSTADLLEAVAAGVCDDAANSNPLLALASPEQKSGLDAVCANLSRVAAAARKVCAVADLVAVTAAHADGKDAQQQHGYVVEVGRVDVTHALAQLAQALHAGGGHSNSMEAARQRCLEAGVAVKQLLEAAEPALRELGGAHGAKIAEDVEAVEARLEAGLAAVTADVSGVAEAVRTLTAAVHSGEGVKKAVHVTSSSLGKMSGDFDTAFPNYSAHHDVGVQLLQCVDKLRAWFGALDDGLQRGEKDVEEVRSTLNDARAVLKHMEVAHEKIMPGSGSGGSGLDVAGALSEFREAQEAAVAVWEEAPVPEGAKAAVVERLNGGGLDVV